MFYMRKILFAIWISVPLSLFAQVSIQTDLSEPGTEIKSGIDWCFFSKILIMRLMEDCMQN